MSKTKTSFKGFLFLLLIIVIIGGVVLAIIFWPKNPENIKDDINNQTSVVLKENGDFLTNLNNYSEYAVNYKTTSEVANNSIESVCKIYSTLSAYFDYMSYTFEDADFSNYELSDIKNAQAGMNDATSKLNTISQFLKEKNDSLTADGFNTKVYEQTDAKLVWDNVKIDIKQSFEYYYKATESLANLYSNNVVNGVYANDFAKVTITGVSYYFNYFQKEFENLGSNEYKTMANDFSNFVNVYLAQKDGAQRMVASYLTSIAIQENTNILLKFSELVKDYKLETLILDGINYRAELFTSEQAKYLEIGVKFFKGEFSL